MHGIANVTEMKIAPECFPCFFRQVDISLNMCEADEGLRTRVFRAAAGEVASADLGKSPAHATTSMHRTVRNLLGGDPFAEIKSRYNRIALGLYPELKAIAAGSPDPLLTAARLAIAGNIIDFGIFRSIDLESTVRRSLEEPLDVDHHALFKEEVERAGEILYLLDNAGEIVFDRILIEELLGQGKRVTAVVKGGPVINDCTMEDARQTGISDVCEVVDNGSDAVGTIMETTGPVFRERFESGALVISKGQGNFETLLGEKRNIFFLFQAKCEVVSRLLGLQRGAMLLAAGRG